MAERLIVGPMSWWNGFRFQLYQFIYNNATTADQYFGLGKDQPLTIETVPVVISGKKHFKLRVELVTEEE